ncbi:MDR/zinc-dependent alcohol dehydrogenase-like family protein [Roseomonas gilardii]|uniref:hypothetical protein n=1 Tax=Roseomonas gilardii TaxID=257708 RepID=UPI000E038440|nr:hypothetical protein [Roseomonas gilardii]SUE44842.1 L-idonate 5-dehydrogenase [Roseomonas gilardii subsp. rosea]
MARLRVAVAVSRGARTSTVTAITRGQTPVMANRIMAREIDLRGAFRFGDVFGDAVTCLEKRQIDIRAILTAKMPMDRAGKAFHAARDRARNLKVVIEFRAGSRGGGTGRSSRDGLQCSPPLRKASTVRITPRISARPLSRPMQE